MIKPYQSSGLAGPTVPRAAPPFASTPGSSRDLAHRCRLPLVRVPIFRPRPEPELSDVAALKRRQNGQSVAVTETFT